MKGDRESPGHRVVVRLEDLSAFGDDLFCNSWVRKNMRRKCERKVRERKRAERDKK
jgi:hypothetical protein